MNQERWDLLQPVEKRRNLTTETISRKVELLPTVAVSMENGKASGCRHLMLDLCKILGIKRK